MKCYLAIRQFTSLLALSGNVLYILLKGKILLVGVLQWSLCIGCHFVSRASLHRALSDILNVTLSYDSNTL